MHRSLRIVPVLATLLLVQPAAASTGQGKTVQTGGTAEAPNAVDDCASDTLEGDRDLCAVWVSATVSGIPEWQTVEHVTFGLRTADPIRLTPWARYRIEWTDARAAADPADPQGCAYALHVDTDATGQPRARFIASKSSFEAPDGNCSWRGMAWQIVGLSGADLDGDTGSMTASAQGTTLQVSVPLAGAPKDLQTALRSQHLHGLRVRTVLEGTAYGDVDRVEVGDVDLRWYDPDENRAG